MRRLVAQQPHIFRHCPTNPASISPLSLGCLMQPSPNKYSFCTANNKRHAKKSRIKIAEDEFRDTESGEPLEEIEEATIEKESIKKQFKENAPKTIYDVEFSEEAFKPRTYRNSFHKWCHINVGLDNILPRMIALKQKDPAAITETLNLFYIAHGIIGLPMLLLFFQCKAYIASPALVLAYLLTRYSENHFPSSAINTRLVAFYKRTYPLLAQCNFSRKCPDPSKQSVDAFADNLTSKIAFLDKLDRMLDANKLGRMLKQNRERVYANSITHGFAWDIADNTRMLVGMPLVFGALYACNIGAYIPDAMPIAVDDTLFQLISAYVCSTMVTRLLSNWSLRTMALTKAEKTYGLRSDSGIYYGFKTEETEGQGKRRSAMMSDEEEEAAAAASKQNLKVSSRKPKKK